MKLVKTTIKDGQTWLTISNVNDWRTVHIDVEAISVEEKGTNIVVKTK